MISNAYQPRAEQIRIAYLIRDADEGPENDKLSLYNASVMMTLVRLYYYAAMWDASYNDMMI